MAWPAPRPGRSLEPCGDAGPRWMTVTNRTRLTSRLPPWSFGAVPGSRRADLSAQEKRPCLPRRAARYDENPVRSGRGGGRHPGFPRLRSLARARRGRDVARLARSPALPRSAGRDQADAAGGGRRSRASGEALPARGPDHRTAAASEHRGDLRHRAAAGCHLHRHGIPGGWHAQRPHARRALARRGGGDHGAARASAPVRARPRGHPPRSEAEQRDVPRSPDAGADRFRHRPAEGPGGDAAHSDRDVDRHADLHEPRADSGP